MRYFQLFTILTWVNFLNAQDGNAIFDNKIELKEGIYTTYTEVLENNPKYYNCKFEINVNVWFGGISMYYYDELGSKYEFKDTILLVVNDGERYISLQNRFHKLILTGAISTFAIETIYRDYSIGYSNSYEKLYFFDIKSGVIDKLNPISIDEIIKRDSLLYADFSTISNSKKKKILYSYILKYNLRNPIYIKME